MKEVCADNENWDACWDCPFDSICDKLMDARDVDKQFERYIPANWREEENENEFEE